MRSARRRRGSAILAQDERAACLLRQPGVRADPELLPDGDRAGAATRPRRRGRTASWSRTLAPGEERDLYEVLEDAFLDHWGHSAAHVRGVAGDARSSSHELCFLVRTRRRGRGRSGLQSASSSGMGWVDVLGTRRDYRRRGLGEALLAPVLPRALRPRRAPGRSRRRRREPDRRDQALRTRRHARRLPDRSLRQDPVGRLRACRASARSAPTARRSPRSPWARTTSATRVAPSSARVSSACRAPGERAARRWPMRPRSSSRTRRRRWSPRTRSRTSTSCSPPSFPSVRSCSAGAAARTSARSRACRRGTTASRSIWIDAHGDLNTPESSPSGNEWGMPLRMIVDSGAVRSTDVALVAVRDLDPPEREFIEEAGVHTGKRRRPARARGGGLRLRRGRLRRPRRGRGGGVHARPRRAQVGRGRGAPAHGRNRTRP